LTIVESFYNIFITLEMGQAMKFTEIVRQIIIAAARTKKPVVCGEL
jgi:hypothetical protein